MMKKGGSNQNCFCDLPDVCGVYQMVGERGKVLYIGKARSIRNRVGQHLTSRCERIRHMVSLVKKVDVTVTYTEVEALLLEAHLIKKKRPPYNILLKDGRPPWMLALSGGSFPRLMKVRKGESGTSFGPFLGPVDALVEQLTRTFRLRSCSDEVMKRRKRPCLFYFTGTCSAPCVGRVSEGQYKDLMAEVLLFLRGKSAALQQSLVNKMEAYCAREQFEKAAVIRDRIHALTRIQSRQLIYSADVGDADVIALYQAGDRVGAQIFCFREGVNCAGPSFALGLPDDMTIGELLSHIILQHYGARVIPPERILLSHSVAEERLVQDALKAHFGVAVRFEIPRQGKEAELVAHAVLNAEYVLGRERKRSKDDVRVLCERLREVFSLPTVPKRIEIYDNSHLSGTCAIGAMVAFGPEGDWDKASYRRLTLIARNDDCAAMEEVLNARFTTWLAQGKELSVPDLILVDGGKGQLSAFLLALHKHERDGIPVIAIAKGAGRRGPETFYTAAGRRIVFAAEDPLLHFLASLRDEAHRFAVSSHRRERKHAFLKSKMTSIPGIGEARARTLLLYFGSMREMSERSVSDFCQVPGISHSLAKKLGDFFRENR